jgi:hypothetical protein
MLTFFDFRLEGVQSMRLKTFLTVGVILLFSSALTALDIRFISEGITRSPSSAKAGDTVTFKAKIHSYGSSWIDPALVSNLNVIGGVDDSTILVKNYSFPSNNWSPSFNWIATEGSHKVWFVIDPDNKTEDVNHNNNRIEETFSVSPPPTIGVQGDTPQVSGGRTRKGVSINRPLVPAPTGNNPSGIADNSGQDLIKKWIKVTNPHSGDYWDCGTSYTIKWDTNVTQGPFTIELYIQQGNTKVQYIGKSSSPSYLWKVSLKPPLKSGLYRIRVSYFIRGKPEQAAEGFSDPFYISSPAG